MTFAWHSAAKLLSSISQSHCYLAWREFQSPDIPGPWASERLRQRTQYIYNKKSRYLNRRENARSNCQKFQGIQGSGESEIVQCWKSFKHLNKHSTCFVLRHCVAIPLLGSVPLLVYPLNWQYWISKWWRSWFHQQIMFLERFYFVYDSGECDEQVGLLQHLWQLLPRTDLGFVKGHYDCWKIP